jgi:hypothetical protein
MVMAETQRSPESVRSARRLRAHWIRQDSAACVSLSSNHLSKSKPVCRDRHDRIGSRRPVAKKTRPTTWSGQASLVSIRRLLPTSRAPVQGAREIVNNINCPAMSTPGEGFSASSRRAMHVCRAANRPSLHRQACGAAPRHSSLTRSLLEVGLSRCSGRLRLLSRDTVGACAP